MGRKLLQAHDLNGYTKNLSAEKLAAQTPEAMAEQLNMTLRTRTDVTAIDTDGKTLQLGDGSLTPSWF